MPALYETIDNAHEYSSTVRGILSLYASGCHSGEQGTEEDTWCCHGATQTQILKDRAVESQKTRLPFFRGMGIGAISGHIRKGKGTSRD